MTKLFFTLLAILVILGSFTGIVFIKVFLEVDTIGLESARTIYLSILTFWVSLSSMLYIARWIWDNLPEEDPNDGKEKEDEKETSHDNKE